MNAVEVLALQQELVALHIPGHITRLGHDLLIGRGRDEALLGFLEVALIFKRERLALPILEVDRELRGHFAFWMEVLSFLCAGV
ncbi:hypothetical protein T190_31565 [Sinorhizobium meliloti CCBAU 01290]|nr:hypothetical protein T190_31565 [Sinorhizobium meliloti CCBAU 01290]